MSNIADIKGALKTRLDALVPGDLSVVELVDITRDPLDGDIVGYPHAFIYPPSLESSEWYDNRTSYRELIFSIMVLMKAEGTTTSDVEDLMETVLNTLENDVTLGGNARAGIQPATSRPEPLSHGGKNLIVFDVTIRARTINELT